MDVLDEALGARGAANANDKSAQLPIVAALQAAQERQEYVLTEIGKWTARLVDAHSGRLETGRRSLRALCEKFIEIERMAAEALQVPRAELQEIERTAMAAPDANWIKLRGRGGLLSRKEAVAFIDPVLYRYFTLRLKELALRESARLAISLRVRLAGLVKQMDILREELDDILAMQDGPRGRTGLSYGDLHTAAEYFKLRPEELLAQAEAQLEADFLEGTHVVPRLLQLSAERRKLLGPAIRQAARNLILRICQTAESTGFGFRDWTDSRSDKSPDSWLAALTPKLLETCGGQRRVLVIKSDDGVQTNLADELAKHVSVPPALMFEPDDQSTVCSEVDQIDPSRVAQMLTGNRREFNELATRLQSRADIEWMDLS